MCTLCRDRRSMSPISQWDDFIRAVTFTNFFSKWIKTLLSALVKGPVWKYEYEGEVRRG